MTSEPSTTVSLDTDVLVLGGGPAGTWAALTAARRGARVVLADKAYCGTSGAAAASNNTAWYVPDSGDHADHHAQRFERGGRLSHARWVAAVLASAAQQLHLLESLGYPFPRGADGTVTYASLRGPDYMRFMRGLVARAGVQILDHCPVETLDRSDGGTVTGARGTSRDGARWHVAAAATVVATGGCAFMGGALGTHVCTGDGLLAAAEAGAVFSGMEFSSQYGIAASFSSVTKGLPFHWASYYRADGREIEVGDEEPFVAVARMLEREPVYACFDQATPDIERWLRSGQAIAFLPYDRMGINPFRERFSVGLRLEGTVRGTGGLQLMGLDAATSVPGLFAAGDAASREPIVGGRSGGGSPNAAWAIATGAWAGEGAECWAREHGRCRAPGPQARTRRSDPVAALSVIRREIWPPARQLFRDAAGMSAALQALDEAWEQEPAGDAVPALAGRQARAMLLVGRMSYRAALERRESRALHQRLDFPGTTDAPRRLQVRGCDLLEVQAVPVGEELAA